MSTYIATATRRSSKHAARHALRSYFRVADRLPRPARFLVHIGVVALLLKVLITAYPWVLLGAGVLAVLKFITRR